MLGTYQPEISNNVNTANSFLASSLIVCGALAFAIQLGTGVAKHIEKQVEVTFVDEIKLEPPKPQQPIELPKVLTPPPPEPIVAANVKTIRTSQPIKMKQIKAPLVMKKGPLAEADASQEKGVYVYTPPAGAAQAQALPTEAKAPVPLPSNREPEYPLLAKKEGRSGLVILKLVVAADGSVADVNILRGEEPFLAEALAAVKTWKYRPATVDGEPISVYHVVKIPFRYEA